MVLNEILQRRSKKIDLSERKMVAERAAAAAAAAARDIR